MKGNDPMLRQNIPTMASDPDMPVRNGEIRLPSFSDRHDMRNGKEDVYEQAAAHARAVQ